MAMLDLVFDGRTFPVPKKSVFQLVGHQELFEAKSYAVQSSVPVEVFEAFVGSLKAQTKISVTQGNAVSMWFLAKEFFLSDLSAECGTFSVTVDQFSRLFERVSSLERQISSFSNPGRQIEGEIASQKRGLENLRQQFERLRLEAQKITRPEIESHERRLENLCVKVDKMRLEAQTVTQTEIESQKEGLERLRLTLENVKSSLEGELSQLRNDLAHLQATSKPSASPSPSPPAKAPDSPTSVPSSPKPSGSPTPKPSPSPDSSPPFLELPSPDQSDEDFSYAGKCGFSVVSCEGILPFGRFGGVWDFFSPCRSVFETF
jgi:hypothetical protein